MQGARILRNEAYLQYAEYAAMAKDEAQTQQIASFNGLISPKSPQGALGSDSLETVLEGVSLQDLVPYRQ